MGMCKSFIPKGFQNMLTKVKHTASLDASLPNKSGIFPLPVDFEGAVEQARQLRGLEAAVAYWLPLTCRALNELSGWKKPAPKFRKGRQLGLVIDHLRDRIRRFLKPFPSAPLDPHEVWKNVKNKQVSYEGVEYTDPVPLTVNQIKKSLPPWVMVGR